MSYNISAWKTKSITGLSIPIEAVWDIKFTAVKLMPGYRVKFSGLAETSFIEGTLKFSFDDKSEVVKAVIMVENIGHTGEGSGSSFDVIEQILGRSTGKMEAVLIWEGGDSVTRITVDNGKVSQSDSEL